MEYVGFSTRCSCQGTHNSIGMGNIELRRQHQQGQSIACTASNKCLIRIPYLQFNEIKVRNKIKEARYAASAASCFGK